MEDNNVLATTEEQSVVSQVTDVACDDDEVGTGHKVVFYIILGLIGLSGVGIPVLVFLLVKEHKKRKQAEDALNEKNGAAAPTQEDAKADEKKSEPEAKEPENK